MTLPQVFRGFLVVASVRRYCRYDRLLSIRYDDYVVDCFFGGRSECFVVDYRYGRYDATISLSSFVDGDVVVYRLFSLFGLWPECTSL